MNSHRFRFIVWASEVLCSTKEPGSVKFSGKIKRMKEPLTTSSSYVDRISPSQWATIHIHHYTTTSTPMSHHISFNEPLPFNKWVTIHHQRASTSPAKSHQNFQHWATFTTWHLLDCSHHILDEGSRFSFLTCYRCLCLYILRDIFCFMLLWYLKNYL